MRKLMTAALVLFTAVVAYAAPAASALCGTGKCPLCK